MTARIIPPVAVEQIPHPGLREVMGLLQAQGHSREILFHRHPWVSTAPLELLFLGPSLGAVKIRVGAASGQDGEGKETWWEEGPPLGLVVQEVRIDLAWEGLEDSQAPPLLGRRDLPRLRQVLAERLGAAPEWPEEEWAAWQRDLELRLDPWQLPWAATRARRGPGLQPSSDQEQVRLALLRHERVAVQGPAGAGKTALALSWACSCARQGEKLLYLCSGMRRAAYLRRHLPPPAPLIRSLLELLEELSGRAGIVGKLPLAPLGARQRFLVEEAPRLLEKVLDRDGRRFDRLVVDEAESVPWSWWPMIERLGAAWELGSMALFRDPSFEGSGTPLILPASSCNLTLPANLRSPALLRDTAAALLPGAQSPPPDCLGKDTLLLLETPASPERARVVEAAARVLLHEQGFQPAQVVLLGPRRLRHSSLRGYKQLAGQRLLSDVARWEDGEGLLYADVQDFRGMEAEAVVLFDADHFTPAFGPRELYHALTRARRQVVFALGPGEIREWFQQGRAR